MRNGSSSESGWRVSTAITGLLPPAILVFLRIPCDIHVVRQTNYFSFHLLLRVSPGVIVVVVAVVVVARRCCRSPSCAAPGASQSACVCVCAAAVVVVKAEAKVVKVKAVLVG